MLFGFENALKKPELIPGTVFYVLLIYLAPALLVGTLQVPVNRLAGFLAERWPAASIVFHLALLYAVLHIWSDINDYRMIVVKITLIAVMLTLSLNVINGDMGEFSLLPSRLHGAGSLCRLGGHHRSVHEQQHVRQGAAAARHRPLPLPLGPHRRRRGYLLLGELAVLAVLAVSLVFLLGNALIALLVNGIHSDLFRVPHYVSPTTYGLTGVITLATVLLSAALIWRRVTQLDLIAVLKARD